MAVKSSGEVYSPTKSTRRLKGKSKHCREGDRPGVSWSIARKIDSFCPQTCIRAPVVCRIKFPRSDNNFSLQRRAAFSCLHGRANSHFSWGSRKIICQKMMSPLKLSTNGGVQVFSP